MNANINNFSNVVFFFVADQIKIKTKIQTEKGPKNILPAKLKPGQIQKVHT